MEQDLKMRVIKDRLEHVYEHEKDSIINLFLALQRQNFVLGNSLTNLIDHWPHEEIVFSNPSERVQGKVQSE